VREISSKLQNSKDELKAKYRRDFDVFCDVLVRLHALVLTVLTAGPHLYRWSQAILPTEGLVEKLWILVAPQPMLNLGPGVEGHTGVPLMSGASL
jgi:hypothetical protein